MRRGPARPWAAGRLLALAAMLLGLVPLAGAAGAAPALWVVKSPSASVYLFGTMHVLEPQARWRTPRLDAAFARAKTVWFETDVSRAADPAVGRDLILRYGLDPDRPLSSRLDPGRLAALKALLGRERTPFAVLDRMRPWAAALMLMAAPMVKAGFDPAAGADVRLTADARAQGKRVRLFETLGQQMRFLADLPMAAQVQLLNETVRDDAKAGSQARAMQSAWLRGDLSSLGPLLIGDLKQTPGLYGVLIRRRNLAWSRTIARQLAGRGAQFVAVGALHMVGPDGLPALLRAKGFSVERVE
ncbi:MAG TPA: TraB/GumN family protein [Caulobacteraceae bacterium]|nr:TraB/GumN family protein [Caulobacteraceae bacterium]